MLLSARAGWGCVLCNSVLLLCICVEETFPGEKISQSEICLAYVLLQLFCLLRKRERTGEVDQLVMAPVINPENLSCILECHKVKEDT